MNQISQSLTSSFCMTVVLPCSALSPSLLSSPSPRPPGFQHTIEFSHDLEKTKSPNHLQMGLWIVYVDNGDIHKLPSIFMFFLGQSDIGEVFSSVQIFPNLQQST